MEGGIGIESKRAEVAGGRVKGRLLLSMFTILSSSLPVNQLPFLTLTVHHPRSKDAPKHLLLLHFAPSGQTRNRPVTV
jgi:hypothetical protein